MKEQIKHLLKIQIVSFVALWALPLLLVVLYETSLLPEGLYAGHVQTEYILQSATILLTIGLVPAAGEFSFAAFSDYLLYFELKIDN